MQPFSPLNDWQKKGLEQIFADAEKHPSPANKTRVQLMYGQLGSRLHMHEVEGYNSRLIKIMNSYIEEVEEEEEVSE